MELTEQRIREIVREEVAELKKTIQPNVIVTPLININTGCDIEKTIKAIADRLESELRFGSTAVCDDTLAKP
jgi:hypothetical protein